MVFVRIKMLHQTKDTFEVPEDFSLDDFMRPSFVVFRGEPTRVRIWFSADVAGYIRERIWHDTQEIHPQVDGSVIFEVEVAGIEEIKFWVLRWSSEALVLEPESLRDEIRVEAESLLKRYEKEGEKEEKPLKA